MSEEDGEFVNNEEENSISKRIAEKNLQQQLAGAKDETEVMQLLMASEKGGFIYHTRNHIDFVDMNDYDKMNYALFMMKYDVNHQKELGIGAAEFSSMKLSDLNTVQGWAKLFKLDTPKNTITRYISLMTYISAFLVVVAIVMLILAYIVRAGPAKKTTLMLLVVFLVGLVIVTYLVDYVLTDAERKIENIQYYIK